MDFQDPWYVQYDGSQQDTNYWIPVTSYYEPTGKAGATDKGVFLNQYPPTDTSHPPYYSVHASLTQTINGYIAYFQNWSASGASLQQVGSNPSGYDQKAVVFNSANAVVTSNYKGIHLSNDASAFSNNSQRKFARTQDGRLHLVYSSIGHVWYEISTDGGTTWTLANNGKPLIQTAVNSLQ